jgi:hypothetical protein
MTKRLPIGSAAFALAALFGATIALAQTSRNGPSQAPAAEQAPAQDQGMMGMKGMNGQMDMARMNRMMAKMDRMMAQMDRMMENCNRMMERMQSVHRDKQPAKPSGH